MIKIIHPLLAFIISPCLLFAQNTPAPLLTIDSLANLGVARPVLKIQAKCTGGCAIDAYGPYGQLIASARDSIPELDLSDYNGQVIPLRIIATGDNGNTAEKTIRVYVESSPHLTEYFTAPGKILDFRYSKVLAADADNGYPVIADISGGQTAALVPAMIQEDQAYLSPYGAVFAAGASIYEWKNGQAISHGSGNNLSVSGHYAAWKRNDTFLLRRDLSLDTTSTISASHAVQGLHVADNGHVVFGRELDQALYPRESSVYMYRNGGAGDIYEQAAIGRTGAPVFSPLTDGVNAIYSKASDDYGPYGVSTLYFYDGRASNILNGITDYKQRPFDDFQISNKHAAFIMAQQVYERDSTGVVRPLTAFSTGCYQCYKVAIDLLNNKGEMTITREGSGRYFIGLNRQLKLVTALLRKDQDGWVSRSFYDDGSWYVAIGRTLFKLNPDVAENHILSFTKKVRPDSTASFTAQDFISRFTGPGQLIHIRITSFPKHGKLQYIYGNIRPDGAVKRSELGTLTYTPDSTYRGRDTIHWAAYNGVSYTADTASVYIRSGRGEVENTPAAVIPLTGTPAMTGKDGSEQPIHAYPNPFHEQFSITGLSPIRSYVISLYNMQGRLIFRKRAVNMSRLQVNMPSPGAGLYILSVSDERAGKPAVTMKLMNY